VQTARRERRDREYLANLGDPHRPGAGLSDDVRAAVDQVAWRGATPRVVADGGTVLGVVQLADGSRMGIKERFGEMRRMGIRTVMIAGDNPVTAAAIAVDDFSIDE
jgi:potassium-transporting ATPase ATP-binding subunit